MSFKKCVDEIQVMISHVYWSQTIEERGLFQEWNPEAGLWKEREVQPRTIAERYQDSNKRTLAVDSPCDAQDQLWGSVQSITGQFYTKGAVKIWQDPDCSLRGGIWKNSQQIYYIAKNGALYWYLSCNCYCHIALKCGCLISLQLCIRQLIN